MNEPFFPIRIGILLKEDVLFGCVLASYTPECAIREDVRAIALGANVFAFRVLFVYESSRLSAMLAVQPVTLPKIGCHDHLQQRTTIAWWFFLFLSTNQKPPFGGFFLFSNR